MPGRAGKRELERFVSQQASTPLDKTKPLWQFHLVESYGGGSALVTRIHHCYADGMALVQVMLSLTDTSREAKKGSHLSKAWLKDDGARVAQRVGAIDRYMKLGGQVLEKGLDFYRDPGLANVVAKEGGEIARELAVALVAARRSRHDAARPPGRQQARGLGRAAGPGGSQGRRPRLRLHRQRRADGVGGRRACAATCSSAANTWTA